MRKNRGDFRRFKDLFWDNGYIELVSGPQEETRSCVFTFSDLSCRLPLVIFCPKSEILKGVYWK